MVDHSMNALAPATSKNLQGDVSDESLIAQYRESGDRGLFEVLMRRYEREMYSYLRRYIGNTEMAEDAFQGTCLQVHLKCHQFDPDRRFRPWLYAIATNQAIDVQRRNKRHRMVSLIVRSNEKTKGATAGQRNWLAILRPSRAARPGNSRWVHDSVDSLSESMQQVIHLVYYRDEIREAADALGIPVGTVKVVCTRLFSVWGFSG